MLLFTPLHHKVERFIRLYLRSYWMTVYTLPLVNQVALDTVNFHSSVVPGVGTDSDFRGPTTLIILTLFIMCGTNLDCKNC